MSRARRPPAARTRAMRSPTRSPMRSPTRSRIRNPARNPTRSRTRNPARNPIRNPKASPSRNPNRSAAGQTFVLSGNAAGQEAARDEKIPHHRALDLDPARDHDLGAGAHRDHDGPVAAAPAPAVSAAGAVRLSDPGS